MTFPSTSLSRNSARSSAAALVVAAWCVWATTAAAAGPVTPTVVTNPASVTIDNFARVNASYYRGGQPTNGEYAQLAALGVKTVIDLTSDDAQPNERSLVEAAGMQYSHIPMTTHTVPTREQLDQFFRIVDDPQRQPIYVHCVGGRHRTGVMTAVYRMTEDGWTSGQAFAEMKQYKFGADFLHPEFKRFVYAYHPDSPRGAVATRAGG